METKTIDMHQTQPLLNDLLAVLASGGEIVLTERDEPVAKMISLKLATKPRVAGLHLGAIQMSDDFNEPLSESFWLGEV